MFKNINKNWDKVLELLNKVEVKRYQFTVQGYLDNIVLLKNKNDIYAFPTNNKINLNNLSKVKDRKYRPKIQIHYNRLNLWGIDQNVPRNLWWDGTLARGIYLGREQSIDLDDKKSIKDKIIRESL